MRKSVYCIDNCAIIYASGRKSDLYISIKHTVTDVCMETTGTLDVLNMPLGMTEGKMVFMLLDGNLICTSLASIQFQMFVWKLLEHLMFKHAARYDRGEDLTVMFLLKAVWILVLSSLHHTRKCQV